MRYETSVVVDRPIDEVWAFFTDPFNLPRFSETDLRIRQTSPGPIGVGTTYEGRVVLFGLERRVSAVITEWDPPHAVVASARRIGLWPGTLREGLVGATLEATSDGTRVVRFFDIELRGIWRLLSPIVRLLYRRRLRAGNPDLKRLLEAERG